jgi:hypothetical protein
MNYKSNSTDARMESVSNKKETIRELAKRHMMDQSHTTSDEELRNAVVELDMPITTEYKASRQHAKSIKNGD